MDEGSIKQKLNAPKKISGFERQRQEAETKRLREEAETRKALRDFQDSFAEEEDDDDDDAFSALAGGRGASDMRDAPIGPRGGPPGGAIAGSLGGPRHFQGQSMRSSGPGTLGPPPSLKRKRELEEERERREREARGGGMRGFDNYDDRSSGRRKSSPEPAVKRPTMLLAQLPKTIKENQIKSLMPANLRVEHVAFVPPAGPGTDRRYLCAIVTVAANTPMSDVDSAVSALQAKYLGFGCYLKISRHITSSGLSSGLGPQNLGALNDFHPFAAKPWINHPQTHSMRNAPPPEAFDNHGYQSYGGPRHQGPSPLVVTIVPPSDLKLLKAVNKTVEKVIQYGSLFERSLLSSPEVQQDEQWAWIFDASSQAHIYYRWLIYEYYCAKTTRVAMDVNNAFDLSPDENWLRSPEGQFAKKNGLLKLFDHGPLFQPPIQRPKFEHVFAFEDLVQDSGYVSSDDESGDENINNSKPGLDVNPGSANYLNPYRRAKFTHLLSRMPDNITFLRAGDVARVTNFVVSNAGTGAEEIVSMLVENVELPYSRAVVYDTSLSDDDDNDPDDWERREKRIKNDEEKARSDPSNAKLIALYLISSALQASSTSGVRDAWKYRGLFETALRSRNTFEHLGRLEKELSWGRMKSEQWKRKIAVVLGLWEKWSLFSADTQKLFKEGFLNPKLNAEEQAEKEKAEKDEKDKKESGKWKSGTVAPAAGAIADGSDAMDVNAATKVNEEKKAQEATKAAEEEEKKKAFADRLANLKKNVRPNRPTAADLLDKEKEEVPAPKISVSGFKMSLGSGSGGPGGAGASGGFSLGAKSIPPKDNGKGKARQSNAGDMFGDSDGE